MHRSRAGAARRLGLAGEMLVIAAAMVPLGMLRLDAALAETQPLLATPATGSHGAAHRDDPETGVIVPLRSGPPAAEATADLRVLESRADGLRLAFELPAIRSQEIQVAGETFQAIAIDNGGFAGEIGHPMLPTFTRLIAIPDGMAVAWELGAVETRELAGYVPLPVQPEEGSDFTIERAAYAAGGYPAEAPVGIGEPAIARHLRVVPVTIRPVRFDPARGTIEIATRAEIEVRFSGADARNAAPVARGPIPASFNQLYRQVVVNYTGSRPGGSAGLGRYVIICPDNSDVIAALQPLVEWRTRKGFDVYLATTTETGATTTQIQTWLRHAYATWENPPEYVTLIGDAGGTVAIPCFTYSGGATDHPYVQLDGTDLLADAHIGRISVESVAQLELYVYKIVHYESTPYMAETDWYTRACLVGDPSYSGYSCIQIMQWLKDRLLDVGYTQVDTVFSGAWISQMTTCLNRGDTVFSYRGYWHMSGFDVGHIAALQNGWKMPFALNPTCDTGSFNSGTSRSEAWIRAGLPGSPPIPTGGIASIGTATLGTHTRYNNCVTYGVWRGVFWEDITSFGGAFTRGKYELYLNYAQGDPGGAQSFTHWNNLMGDPAGELWTGVPRPLTVDHATELGLGVNAAALTVTSDGAPVAGATVCLWQAPEVWVVGTTDESGRADLLLGSPTSGIVAVTVTKHDHQPYLGTIRILPFDLFVAYERSEIDDDQTGTSFGNSDGLVNPAEAIELRVMVRNHGTGPATGVSAVLATTDPYVTITDDQENFGDIPAGSSAWSVDDFDFAVAPGAPGGHVVHFALDVTSGAQSWHSLIGIPIDAGRFAYEATTLSGFGTLIDPGESGQISVRLANIGTWAAIGVTGTLRCASPWITITDSTGTFGTIGIGQTGENTTDTFALNAAPDCFPGHIAPFSLALAFSGGAVQVVDFALPVGTATSTAPTGPDAYGYYAFDDTDTSYPQAPVYDWIELDPTYGGPGADVGLTDFGEDQDDVRVLALPFPFRYYGESFTEITACANGWITMGRTRLTNYRNWRIPCAGAPPYLIAPMWDNLYQSGTNRVYHWYDEADHRYVIQWSRLRNLEGGATENFEVVLYDPTYYTSETGDGIILFQYDTFNNSDYLQHYSSVGIQNGDNTDGILYQYFNLYTSGSATIQTGRAIRFVSLSSRPRGTLAGHVRNASYGNAPIPLAEVRLQETGEAMYTGPDGSYGGSIVTGRYTLIASRPGFASQTVPDVLITEGQTTQVDFALVDNAGPIFSTTTVLGNTPDTQGPYEVFTRVEELSGLADLSLLYNAAGEGWIAVPLDPQGGDLYRATIPGQPYGTLVSYYLRGEDSLGHIATDPPTAPQEVYAFWVLAPLISEDGESGVGGWTHEVATAGYVDQWHLSAERNHTPGGTWSWKFGDNGTGNYADMADGALVSEIFTLEGEAMLTFWHWMRAEASSSYPGYAYDGGFAEISVDGGPWTQITPNGGYPYRVRVGSGPGPYPAETPIYSGTCDWTEAAFSLTGIVGQIQLRFRFGSDGADNDEGWHIDDLLLMPAEPGMGAARELALRPASLVLHQNAPNPFGPERAGTVIHFDLPQAGEVRLEVIDTSGRLVRTLLADTLPAGRHQTLWNGRGPAGEPVASGIYFYQLEHAGGRQAKQLLIVR